MENGIFQFKLGQFTCFVLQDENLESNVEQLFSTSLSVDEVQKIMGNHGFEEQNLVVSYNFLLVDTGLQKILFDVGNPDGKLVDQLAKIGILPSAIDTVIISHGHPDHYGDLLDQEGSLVFENAEHLMFAEELNDWVSDEALEKLEAEESVHLSYVQSYLLPAKDIFKTFSTDNLQLFDFVQAMPTYGHSKHHLSFEIESDGERLLFAGDVGLHPLHFLELDWQFSADVNHDMAKESRQKVREWSAENDGIILLCHYNFPGLGKFTVVDSKPQWIPFE